MLVKPKRAVSIPQPKPEAGAANPPKPLPRKRRRAPPRAANQEGRSHAENEDQVAARRSASACAEAVRSSARRRSSATSSPRSRPRIKRQLRGTAGIHSTNAGFGQSHDAVRVAERTMPRVKRGVTAHARHKKVLDAGRRDSAAAARSVYRIAKEAVMKAGPVRSTAIAGRRSASSARCGSPASTPPCASSG